MKVILLLIALTLACTSVKVRTGMCNKEEAMEISDQEIKRKGYKIETLLRIVRDSQESYVIHYQPKDTLIRGNEAEIIIAKHNCEILEKKFYQ